MSFALKLGSGRPWRLAHGQHKLVDGTGRGELPADDAEDWRDRPPSGPLKLSQRAIRHPGR